jgi:hypothetical protein
MRMTQFSKVIRSALLASMVAMAVAGCLSPATIGSYLPNYFANSESQRLEDIKWLGSDKGPVSDQFWAGLLGNSVIYLPDSYREDLTKDEDTFLKYVIGSLLARNNITYEMLVAAMQAKGYEVPVTREVFNYYKGFGGAWEADLKRRNVAMAQRYELFKKRVSSDAAGKLLFKPKLVRELLRDDVALEKFLKDDAFAKDWTIVAVDQNFSTLTADPAIFDLIALPWKLLRPVTIGVLPGLAS